MRRNTAYKYKIMIGKNMEEYKNIKFIDIIGVIAYIIIIGLSTSIVFYGLFKFLDLVN